MAMGDSVSLKTDAKQMTRIGTWEVVVEVSWTVTFIEAKVFIYGPKQPFLELAPLLRQHRPLIEVVVVLFCVYL